MGGDLIDDALAQPEHLDEILIENPRAARSDRAHRQFLVTGYTELAHDEHVEWHVEGLCHFKADGDSTPRQGEDDHIGAADVLVQLRCEPPAGFSPICKLSIHNLYSQLLE